MQAMRDKQRIGGFDDDQIIDADDRNQALFGVNVAIVRVVQENLAATGVAVFVFGLHFPQR